MQETCGGCSYLNQPYEVELHQKELYINQLLEQYKIPIQAEPITTAGERIHYRNRLRLQVLDGQADFFNKAKRSGCIVIKPSLWNAIKQLRDITAANPSFLQNTQHLELRIDDQGSTIGLFVPQKPSPELKELLDNNWLISHPDLDHPPALSYRLDTQLSIDVPINCFVQINSEVNRAIIKSMLEITDKYHPSSFIDLYAGSGNFSLPLVKKGIKGTAVESHPQAFNEITDNYRLIEDLNYQTKLKTLNQDVHTAIYNLKPADLVICNPARAGLKNDYKLIADLCLKIFIYIGCNAKSMISDLSQLTELGLKVKRIMPFNMFPGTKHVETMALLTREHE